MSDLTEIEEKKYLKTVLDLISQYRDRLSKILEEKAKEINESIRPNGTLLYWITWF